MLKRLLVLVLLSALVLGAACGDDGGDDSNGNNGNGTPESTAAPNATHTPPPEQTAGTVSVDPTSAALGQALTVTGSGWKGEGAVAFYLLTAEQSGDNQTAARAIANQDAVKLGEASSDADGNVSFEFSLDSGLSTEAGDPLGVASGSELTVFALQGGSGSRAEPLTVQ